jgi:hypothetical protein
MIFSASLLFSFYGLFAGFFLAVASADVKRLLRWLGVVGLVQLSVSESYDLSADYLRPW